MFLHPEAIITQYGSKLVWEENVLPSDVRYLNRDRWINYDCVLEYLIATGFRDGWDICGLRGVSKLSEMFDTLLNAVITQEALAWSALNFNVPPVESINLYPLIADMYAESADAGPTPVTEFLAGFQSYATTRIALPQASRSNDISPIAAELFQALRSSSDVVAESEMMSLTESIRIAWKDVMVSRVLSTVLEMDTVRTQDEVIYRLKQFSASEQLVSFIEFFFGAFDSSEVVIFNPMLDLAMTRNLVFSERHPTSAEWICRALLD